MTLGEYRVGISFNPGKNPLVDRIKHVAAGLIDMINEMEHGEDSEVKRLQALALTHIEDGAMWAVKAATKSPRE